MAAELNFEKNSDGYWEASFVTSGNPMAIEIDRKEKGHLLIYAGVDDLKGDLIFSAGRDCEQHFVRSIDTPEEVTLKVISFTEVIGAKVTGI